MLKIKYKSFFGLTIAVMLITGCATTTVTDERDPWEGWNRKVHSMNETLDDYAMKPVAKLIAG